MDIHTLRQIASEILKDKKPDYKMDAASFSALLDMAQMKHLKVKIGLPEDYQPGAPISRQVMGISRKNIHDLAPLLKTHKVIEEIESLFITKYFSRYDDVSQGVVAFANVGGMLRIEVGSGITGWLENGDIIEITGASGLYFHFNGRYNVVNDMDTATVYIETNSLYPSLGMANGDTLGTVKRLRPRVKLSTSVASDSMDTGDTVEIRNAAGLFLVFNGVHTVFDIDGNDITLDTPYPDSYVDPVFVSQETPIAVMKDVFGQLFLFGEVLPDVEDGILTLPSDYFYLSTCDILTEEEEEFLSSCKLVTDEEYSYLLGSAFPVSEKESVLNLQNGYFRILPRDEYKAEMIYVKRPLVPRYAVSFVGGFNQYDEVRSQSLEWDDSNQLDILFILLSDIGVAIQREDIFNVSEKVKQAGV